MLCLYHSIFKIFYSHLEKKFQIIYFDMKTCTVVKKRVYLIILRQIEFIVGYFYVLYTTRTNETINCESK